MNVQELLNILNDKEAIPNPENAEIKFYFTNIDNKDVELEFWSSTNSSFTTDIGLWFWDKNR